MGCLIANVECRRIDSSIVVGAALERMEITPTTVRIDAPINLLSTTERLLIDTRSARLDKTIGVTVTLICDVGVGEFIRFALNSLSWIGDDNAVGEIKYNTLTSSGAWSLEEVEIEELL